MKNNKYTDMTEPRGERLILSHNIHLPLKTGKGWTNLNTLVIGASGSGKTQYFIKPNLYDKPKDTSFVIIDPSGDLWKSTHEDMQRAGYDTVYFNPLDEENSLKFNPFNYMYKKGDEGIKEYADKLFDLITIHGSNNDLFWANLERNLLEVIMLYCAAHPNSAEGVTGKYIIDTLSVIIKEINDNNYSFFDISDCGKLFTSISSACKIMNKHDLFSAGIDLSGMLVAFALKDVENITSEDHCKVYTLFNRPTVVYIGISESDRTCHFLSLLLLKECIDEVCKRNSETPQTQHVRFVLYEFDNIYKINKLIPMLPNIFGAAGSANYSFEILTQNIEQLARAYKDEMPKYITNIDNILFLGSDNDLTRKFISDICQKSSDGLFVINESDICNHICNLPDDKCIVALRNKQPVIDVKYNYWQG